MSSSFLVSGLTGLSVGGSLRSAGPCGSQWSAARHPVQLWPPERHTGSSCPLKQLSGLQDSSYVCREPRGPLIQPPSNLGDEADVGLKQQLRSLLFFEYFVVVLCISIATPFLFAVILCFFVDVLGLGCSGLHRSCGVFL